MSEMALLNVSVPPAFIATNGCPRSAKSTTVTEPAGPLGESAGKETTRSMRESGNTVT
jgi:hypothetical protein